MDDRALISYQIWGTEGHPHSLVKADNLQTWLSIHRDTMDEDDPDPECLVELKARSDDEAFAFYEGYVWGEPVDPARYQLNKQAVIDLQRGYYRGVSAREVCTYAITRMPR